MSGAMKKEKESHPRKDTTVLLLSFFYFIAITMHGWHEIHDQHHFAFLTPSRCPTSIPGTNPRYFWRDAS